MTRSHRREALTRLVLGVPFVILYVFILFPVVFAVGLVLGAIDILWKLTTGREGLLVADLWIRYATFIADNLKWVVTGYGRFQWTP